MAVGGQRHTPAALPPGNTRYPLYRRLGGSQVRSGQVRKISPPTGIRSPNRPARSESLYRLPPYTQIQVKSEWASFLGQKVIVYAHKYRKHFNTWRLFITKQNILSQWRKKFRICKMFKCSVRPEKGLRVNIRIVVRTDTKTCEINRYVSVTLNVCDC